MKSWLLLAGTVVIGVWSYWNLAVIIDVFQWIVALVIGGLAVVALIGLAAVIVSAPLALIGLLLGGMFFGGDC